MHQPIRPLRPASLQPTPLQGVTEASIAENFRGLGTSQEKALQPGPQMMPQEIPFIQEKILMPPIEAAESVASETITAEPIAADSMVAADSPEAITLEAITPEAITPASLSKPSFWTVIVRGFQGAFQAKPLVTLSSLWIILLVLGWMATAEIISPGNDQPKPKTPIAEAQREQSSSLGLLGAIGFSCATISIILAQQLGQDRRR